MIMLTFNALLSKSRIRVLKEFVLHYGNSHRINAPFVNIGVNYR
jgi:hypothetical protein